MKKRFKVFEKKEKEGCMAKNNQIQIDKLNEEEIRQEYWKKMEKKRFVNGRWNVAKGKKGREKVVQRLYKRE